MERQPEIPRNESVELTAEQQQIIEFIEDVRKDALANPEDYGRIQAGLRELASSHEDINQYRLFHIAIGSTVPASVTKFDLPNGEIQALMGHLFDSKEQS